MNIFTLMVQNIHYIVALITAGVLIYLVSRSESVEGWEWMSDFWGLVNLTGNSSFSPNANYQNQCMTKKPYGGANPMYHYYRTLEKEFPKKYAHCTRFQCGNDAAVKPYESQARTRTQSRTDAHSISVDYYHDPIGYCTRHPDRYPCPNFWIKNGSDIRPVSLRVSKLKDSLKPQVVTMCGTHNLHELSLCNVNDNDRALMVHPGKEDQALC